MIIWNPEDLEDPEADLCSTYDGKYVDVVQDYKERWWPMYDGNHILDREFTKGLPSRKSAIEFLEKYIKLLTS